MKEETKENFESTVKLTAATLQKLKDKGLRYVQEKGFTNDTRTTHNMCHP